jgi:hypothetical protein
MPWSDSTSCTDLGSSVQTGATLGAASGISCLGALIQDGELKASFTTATNILNNILIRGDDNSVTSCFKPESKSQVRDGNTRYSSDGTLRADCVSQTGGTATDCYWCTM